MKQVQQQANKKGLTPLAYVRTKPAYEPKNKEEYIQSLAEYGIESDIHSEDSLSWDVELSDIQETLEQFPDKTKEKETKTRSIDSLSQNERELLGSLLRKEQPPKGKNNPSQSKGKNPDGPDAGL